MALEPVRAGTSCIFSTVGSLSSTVGSLSAIALTICAFVAAAGLIAGPTMGSLYIGLGGGGAVAGIIGLSCRTDMALAQKKPFIFGTVLVGILWCSVGAAGVAGLMTGVQLGWVLTGIVVTSIGLSVIAAPCLIYRMCRGRATQFNY